MKRLFCYWETEDTIIASLCAAFVVLCIFGVRSCVWANAHCKPTSEVRHEMQFVEAGNGVLVPVFYDEHKHVCDDGSQVWR